MGILVLTCCPAFEQGDSGKDLGLRSTTGKSSQLPGSREVLCSQTCLPTNR